MISKNTIGQAAQHLGDVVILSTSNLSMFVVELDIAHVQRLIELIQPTHEFFNKSRNPKSHAEAIGTLKLSRVQRMIDVCTRFDEMVRGHATHEGHRAVQNLQKNLRLHSAQISAKRQKLLQARANLSRSLAE